MKVAFFPAKFNILKRWMEPLSFRSIMWLSDHWWVSLATTAAATQRTRRTLDQPEAIATNRTCVNLWQWTSGLRFWTLEIGQRTLDIRLWVNLWMAVVSYSRNQCQSVVLEFKIICICHGGNDGRSWNADVLSMTYIETSLAIMTSTTTGFNWTATHPKCLSCNVNIIEQN